MPELTILRKAQLRDTLYHAHPHSGASVEHACGVVQGVVGGLMAAGDLDYLPALQVVAAHWPRDGRITCVPPAWRADLEKLLKEVSYAA